MSYLKTASLDNLGYIGGAVSIHVVINKLKDLFGTEVDIKTDSNNLDNMEFSLISPTGIELLIIRLHDGKVGSMRCGDKIMNLPLD